MRQNPTTYEGSKVLIGATLSGLVYERRDKLCKGFQNTIGCPPPLIRSIPKYNSRVVVATTDDTVYVVLRGTIFTSWRSWRANLGFHRSQWMKGRVHSGFLKLQKKAKKIYQPVINRPAHRDKAIVFLGHSQGGAVAFVAAIDHSAPWSTGNTASNITFGQPRTGNKKLCRLAEARIGATSTRVANGRDVVIGIPYVWQGYDHLRWFYHYRRKGKVVRRYQRPGKGWYTLRASIPKHAIKRYEKRAGKNSGVVIP